MKIKHLLILMLMALIMPLAANAQVECKLTVNNGTDMLSVCPPMAAGDAISGTETNSLSTRPISRKWLERKSSG